MKMAGFAAYAPLHSETPDMILDRLTILALSIYHLHEGKHPH